MIKTKKSTFDREMKDLKFKKAFYESYKDFLLSELIIALMERDQKSVRQLAKETHLSATMIQNIRSQKQTDLKLSNFLSIVHAFGYQVTLERGSERISL